MIHLAAPLALVRNKLINTTLTTPASPLAHRRHHILHKRSFDLIYPLLTLMLLASLAMFLSINLLTKLQQISKTSQ